MDTTELLFPKVKSKKKRKKHHVSIIPCNRKGVCYLCKRHTYTHEHHIFDGANRSRSEEYGLKVYLCVECHETGKEAVHTCARTRKYLEKIGQQEFERQVGSSNNGKPLALDITQELAVYSRNVLVQYCNSQSGCDKCCLESNRGCSLISGPPCMWVKKEGKENA